MECIGYFDRRLQHPAGSNKSEVLPVANLDCFAQLEVNLSAMDPCLSRSSQTQVAWTGMRPHRSRGGFRFDGITGCYHDHSGKRPQNRQIFRRMMSRTKRSVCQSATNRYNFYVRVVITHVIAHLLKAPQN